MGNVSSVTECFAIPDYIIKIKTGDTKGSGLHNSAHIVLINEHGKKSRNIQLNGCSFTVFKKGRTDKFKVTKLPNFGRIERIIIERHRDQDEVDWFVDYVIVKYICDNMESETLFPVYRWLKVDKPLEICEFDSSLPQQGVSKEQRKNELEIKQLVYLYHRDKEDLPPKMAKIPHDEIFSNFYKWDLIQKKTDLHRLYHTCEYDLEENWRSFEEIENIFKDKGKFRRPKVLYEDWMSDIHFGNQRIKGCNPQSLMLCTELPENFNVTDELVGEYLDGLTLNEAIEQNLLFIVNHSILDGIYDSNCNQNIPSPMALFYLNKKKQLIPIAIQLYQQSGDRNPIFVPNDPYYTWLLAKIWFNYADATFHRTCLLLTLSQWLLEIICLSMHRQLSPSHPIFKLLAPYLRFVLAINHFEMRPLLKEDGWVDMIIPVKLEGYNDIIIKYWKEYNFRESNICRSMEKKKVLQSKILKDYPYRDDCLLLHNCIESYITTIVGDNYEDENELLMDEELQGWASEMANKDICDIKGLPGNGEIQSNETLVEILTEIIYKATVEHAAFSLPLYDEAAFVPNYPLAMRGPPPNSKDSLSEADVMEHLPTKHVTLELVMVNKIISERGTSGMADSRALYSLDPVSSPVRERFLGTLREAAAKITVRNRKRKSRYDYLNPASSKTQFLHS